MTLAQHLGQLLGQAGAGRVAAAGAVIAGVAWLALGGSRAGGGVRVVYGPPPRPGGLGGVTPGKAALLLIGVALAVSMTRGHAGAGPAAHGPARADAASMPGPPGGVSGGSGGPWSIYAQPAGAPAAWARDLVAALGLRATAARTRFVRDWERSEGGGGKWNPLNQGPVPGRPGLTSTGQQYGGGAADYVSWQAGLAGAVAYLHMPSYAGVLAGLRAGNYSAAARALWASPWAASHYGWGAAWRTS